MLVRSHLLVPELRSGINQNQSNAQLKCSFVTNWHVPTRVLSDFEVNARIP